MTTSFFVSHSQNCHGNRFNNNNLMSQPAQPEADTIEAKMSWEPLWAQVSIQQPDEQFPGKTIFLSSVQLHGFMIWLPNKKMGIIFSCFYKLFSMPPVLLLLCCLSGLLWPHTCLSQCIYKQCSFTGSDNKVEQIDDMWTLTLEQGYDATSDPSESPARLSLSKR